MNSLLKTLLLTTPALLAAAPATQPTPAPATQPAPAAISQSNEPLVIPDGTSPQNPGPQFRPVPPQWGGEPNGAQWGEGMFADGVRF